MNQERKILPGYVKASFSSESQSLKSAVLEGRAFWDRISLAFALRLVQAFSNRLGYHQILDEIDFLEGLRANSRTKPAMPFDSPALKPLWHKHFSAPRHVLKNIGVRWALDRKGNRDLDRLIGSIAKAGSDRWAINCAIKLLSGVTRKGHNEVGLPAIGLFSRNTMGEITTSILRRTLKETTAKP